MSILSPLLRPAQVPATWGDIGGNVLDQADLVALLLTLDAAYVKTNGSAPLTADWDAGPFAASFRQMFLTADSNQIYFNASNFFGSGPYTVLQDSATVSGKVLTLPDATGTLVTTANITQSFLGPLSWQNSLSPDTDNTRDLGLSGRRVKDFYIAGSLKDNTKSINVTNIAALNVGETFSALKTFSAGLTISGGPFRIYGTHTAAGTTGAQTINKASGSVNFAAAAASLVVTNSNVTTNSIVLAVVMTNDATMKSVQAVPASGSFTLYPNAVPTAETRVGFLVINVV